MKNINKILKKLLKLLENHLNLVILMIFVIIILYASWLLYNFVYISASALPEISFEKVEIKKAVFDRVIEQLNAREQNILEAMNKNYSDIFR